MEEQEERRARPVEYLEDFDWQKQRSASTGPTTGVPDVCPQCGVGLGTQPASMPVPHWSLHARVIFALGCLLSLALQPVVFVLFSMVIGQQAVGGMLDMALQLVVVGALSVVIALPPALLAGRIAYNLPRIVDCRCWNCDWTKRIELPLRR